MGAPHFLAGQGSLNVLSWQLKIEKGAEILQYFMVGCRQFGVVVVEQPLDLSRGLGTSGKAVFLKGFTHPSHLLCFVVWRHAEEQEKGIIHGCAVPVPVWIILQTAFHAVGHVLQQLSRAPCTDYAMVGEGTFSESLTKKLGVTTA